MTRDETKRAAEEALRGDAYGATDRELWIDIERRKYARALLAQCEREDRYAYLLGKASSIMHSFQYDSDMDTPWSSFFHARFNEDTFFAYLNEIDAAIKAIEEGRG
jgi:hypothetical protein